MLTDKLSSIVRKIVLYFYITINITLFMRDLHNKQINEADIGSNRDVVCEKDALEIEKTKQMEFRKSF